jgi:hypothetical protein
MGAGRKIASLKTGPGVILAAVDSQGACMRFLFFSSAIVLALSFPAFAQDSGGVITVIGDDGKATTIEIPAIAPPPEPEPPPPPGAMPAPPEMTSMPEAAPVPPEEEIPVPAKKAKPVVAKALPALPVPPPLPSKRGGKPTAGELQDVLYQSPAYADPVPPPGGALTKEQAIAIAMDTVPPTRGVSAVPRQYQGRQIYAVTFRLENGGMMDVLVDSQTGEIIPTPVPAAAP